MGLFGELVTGLTEIMEYRKEIENKRHDSRSMANQLNNMYQEEKARNTDRENNRPENRAKNANQRRQICDINRKNGVLSDKHYYEAMHEMKDDLEYYDDDMKGPYYTLPKNLFK